MSASGDPGTCDRVGHDTAIDGGQDAGLQERSERTGALAMHDGARGEGRRDGRQGQRKEKVAEMRTRHLRIVLESHG